MNVNVYDMKIKSEFSSRAGTVLIRIKNGLTIERKSRQVEVCFVYSVVRILRI